MAKARKRRGTNPRGWNMNLFGGHMRWAIVRAPVRVLLVYDWHHVYWLPSQHSNSLCLLSRLQDHGGRGDEEL